MRIREFIKKRQSIICVYTFIVTLVLVYIPLVNFLSNQNDYKVSLRRFFPVILAGAAIGILALIIMDVIINRGKGSRIYYILIFSVSICMYVQYNFINPHFPSFNGVEPDWMQYKTYSIVSTIIWITVTSLCIIIGLKYKDIFYKWTGYLSAFLSLVLLLSLTYIAITSKKPNFESTFVKEDQFSIGRDVNIVIFLIDACEYTIMQDYLASEDYEPGTLDDFTFYYHATSGGSQTCTGLPVLLTGSEYDPMQDFDEYSRLCWEDTDLYDDLHSKDFDVRFFDEGISGFPNGIADNYTETEYYVKSYFDMAGEVYKLSGFLAAPQLLKPYLFPNIMNITESVNTLDKGYKEDDLLFYNDLISEKIDCEKYSKTFRFYHLYGSHLPRMIDKNFNPIENDTDEYNTYDQACADFKIINEYINQLKELGLYDNTMIVISGDHGLHGFQTLQARPGVMIKNLGEKHELIVDASPISLKNVYATLAQNAFGEYSKYGMSVFDVSWDKNRDIVRYHSLLKDTVDTLQGAYEKNTPYPGMRVFCEQQDDGQITYYEWNPYQINRIEYELGDILDFTSKESKNDLVREQVIVEKDYITAGAELSICFDIQNKLDRDELELNMNVDSILGKEKKMMVYANGQRLDTHMFTGGENYKLSVPTGIIDDDGVLIFRFVFPGANTTHQLDVSSDDWRVKSINISSIQLK